MAQKRSEWSLTSTFHWPLSPSPASSLFLTQTSSAHLTWVLIKSGLQDEQAVFVEEEA